MRHIIIRVLYCFILHGLTRSLPPRTRCLASDVAELRGEMLRRGKAERLRDSRHLRVGFRQQLLGARDAVPLETARTAENPANEDELNRARVEEVDVAFLETGEYGWVGWRSRTCCAAAELRHAAPAIGRRGASPRRRRR